MQHTAIFEEQVTITPRDMKRTIDSIDEILQDKIQTRLEGRCSRHGYVEPGTVKILSRSMGTLEKGRFTGSILFHAQAEGSVLNPPDGFVLEGIVIRKNKMGMYVSYQDAIRVIIPRDLHIGDEAFESVEIGETVRVEIKKSRFQVNDPYILSVGLFRGSVKKAPAPVEEQKPVEQLPPPAEAQEGEGEEAEDEGPGIDLSAEEDAEEQAPTE
jgi:DNA-directed RNA polymerase subunit E'/Rpb7